MEYDVAVIGAGPAGSTSAIVLARSGLRVCLIDKDEFPRHKVCGEFLSGDGAARLRRLGLESALHGAGAVAIDRCLVSSAAGGVFRAALPGRPLSISRFELDRILLLEAERAGATVRTGTEVSDVSGSIRAGFEVGLRRSEPIKSRFVICAFGRSSSLERAIGRSRLEPAGDPLVAFKAHYAGAFDDGVVELHGFRGGYCGIQKVEAGRVNVCWITRASVLREAGGKPAGMTEFIFERNPLLGKRLRHLELIGQGHLAVSQLNLRPRTAFEGDLMMVGDSAGMIAPMAGDGMSMAISGGMFAAHLVKTFLARGMDVAGLKKSYRRGWSAAFRKRMWVGRLLHAGYERPPVGHAGIRVCDRFPSIGGWLIRTTRG